MNRQNNFDFLRLFAASLVIIGHGFALMGHKPPMFAGAPVSALGVSIFFTISGYLISASWERDPNIARFFAKRALRLFPALVVVSLITVFVAGPILTSFPQNVYWSHPVTYEYLLNIAMHVQYFLPGLFVDNPLPRAVNGSLWSLPVEFVCYMLIPVAAILSIQRRAAAYIALALILPMCAGYLFLYYREQIVIYATDVRAAIEVIAYFCAGAAFWILRERVSFNFKGILAAVATLVLLSLLPPSWIWTHLPVAAVSTVAIAYIIMAVADGSVVKLPDAAKFGDLSYGTYLYAFPVQQIIARYLGPSVGIAGGMAVAFLTVLPIAFLSWHCVEKRALAVKPGRARQRNVESPIHAPALAGTQQNQ